MTIEGDVRLSEIDTKEVSSERQAEVKKSNDASDLCKQGTVACLNYDSKLTS